MLDICLLGTGGMMPLPRRHLTSLMARFNGSNILIDCGEATQVAIKKKGWSFKSIDLILFTHYHGDHIGRFMEIPDDVGSLTTLLDTIHTCNINIEYLYVSYGRDFKSPLAVLKVAGYAEVEPSLKSRGYHTV